MKFSCITGTAALILALSLTSCTTNKADSAMFSQWNNVKSTECPDNHEKKFVCAAEEVSSSSQRAVPVTELKTESTTEKEKRESNLIEVTCILQNPELPTGCEITSLTMLLNYLGYDAEKTEMASEYLTKDLEGVLRFDEAFIGDPTWEAAYGCFAPVIQEAAQKYLDDQYSIYDAYDISGLEFEELFDYIDNGCPVVIWASMDLEDIYKYINRYDENDEPIYWYENEHCMLLTGYDKTNNTVTAADPMYGIREYSLERFKYMYNELEKQAVVIY